MKAFSQNYKHNEIKTRNAQTTPWKDAPFSCCYWCFALQNLVLHYGFGASRNVMPIYLCLALGLMIKEFNLNPKMIHRSRVQQFNFGFMNSPLLMNMTPNHYVDIQVEVEFAVVGSGGY